MGICCAYQLGYTLLSLVRTPRWKPGPCTNKYAVLICARNEAAVLPKLLESLRAQDYPGVLDLYVAADNCTDDTAHLARKAGATVFERHDRTRVGKGYALDFLVHRIWAEGKHYDGYILFDADNLARPDFVRGWTGYSPPAARWWRATGTPRTIGAGWPRARVCASSGRCAFYAPPHPAGLQRQRDRHRLSGERGDFASGGRLALALPVRGPGVLHRADDRRAAHRLLPPGGIL